MKLNKNSFSKLPSIELEILDFLKNIKEAKPKVELIIPTLNEEKTIGYVIEKSFFYVDKVLVIDGGSDDNTVKIAKEKGARIIFQNGRGKGAALKEAFDYVDSEIFIMLDGDGSMRPSEIPIFLNEIYSGADIVKGSRYISEGGSDDLSLLRKFGNTLFTILVNIIWKSNFTDLCYGFMAFKKEAAKKLSPILRSNGFSIETEIIIKAQKLDLVVAEVPSFELKRFFGKSKLKTFRDGLSILLTILREVVK